MQNEPEIEQLLVDLIILLSLEKYDSALDLQFETIENWLFNGQLDLCEKWMNDERLLTLNDELLLNVFVVTKPYAKGPITISSMKSFVEAREIFYFKVKEHFSTNNSSNDTKNFLERMR